MNALLIGWLLLAAAPPSGADDNPSVASYRPSDFYYYDESGLARGLVLLPKFAVFFEEKYPSEKNADYFRLFNEQVATVTNVEFNRYLECAAVEFQIDPQAAAVQVDLVKKLNAANLLAKSIAVVKPVILLDGREVVPTDRIALEITEAIDLERARDRLVPPIKTLGDFTVRAFDPTGPSGDGKAARRCELEVKELRWPPNIFILANLLDEQDWIKEARVALKNFAFPLDINFQIVPDGFPTLGEKRRLVMTVVSDADIELDQSLLPQLGQGEFYFRESLPEVFFQAEPVQIEEAAVTFGKRVAVSWPFRVFASGIYYFSPINIPYVNTKTKENAVVQVVPGRVMINSIIRDSAIDDIQPLIRQPLPLPAAAVPGSGRPMIFFVTGALFILAALATAMVGVGLLGWQAIAGWLGRSKSENGRQKCLRLKRATSSVNLFDYQQLERYLREVISGIFHLPHNIQVSDLNHCAGFAELPGELGQELIFCLSELAQRFVKDYQPTEATLKSLADKLRAVADEALRREKK